MRLHRLIASLMAFVAGAMLLALVMPFELVDTNKCGEGVVRIDLGLGTFVLTAGPLVLAVLMSTIGRRWLGTLGVLLGMAMVVGVLMYSQAAPAPCAFRSITAEQGFTVALVGSLTVLAGSLLWFVTDER